MAKKPRLRYKSAFYHVYTRGVRKLPLFMDEEDCKKILYIFNDAVEKFHFHIISFCLMNNHFHFLIQTYDNKEDISKLMHYVDTRYAMYFNKKYKLSGHVFEDTFESKIVYDRKGLLRLIKYIERNPVKAKIINNCEDWVWNSASILYNKTFNLICLNQDFIKEYFAGYKNPQQEFLEFINYNDPNDELFDPLNMTNFLLAEIEKYLKEKIFQSQKEITYNKLIMIREITSLSLKETCKLLNIEYENGKKNFQRIQQGKTETHQRIMKNLHELQQRIKEFI